MKIRIYKTAVVRFLFCCESVHCYFTFRVEGKLQILDIISLNFRTFSIV